METPCASWPCMLGAAVNRRRKIANTHLSFSRDDDVYFVFVVPDSVALVVELVVVVKVLVVVVMY